jgi:hypothetical protein
MFATLPKIQNALTSFIKSEEVGKIVSLALTLQKTDSPNTLKMVTLEVLIRVMSLQNSH